MTLHLGAKLRTLQYVKKVPHKFGSVKGQLAICYNESKKIDINPSFGFFLQIHSIRFEPSLMDI